MEKQKVKKVGLALLPVIVAVSFLVYKTSSINENDKLLLENVEALSNGENSGERIKCYTSLVYELGASVVDCTTCKRVQDRTDKWSNFHDYCMTK